jgi:hypothetical protein
MRKHFILLLITLQIFIMGLGIWVRFVDHDEGFYLSAAYLISQGKWLYKDFFYPQMPLFPYLMAGVGKIAGFSILINRIIGLLSSLVIFLFIVFYLQYRFRNYKGGSFAALVAGYLYAMHTLVFHWHTVSKPYSHTAFLLLLAAISMLLASERKIQFKKGMFFCGLLWGIACGIKLFYLPLIFPFLLFIIGNKDLNKEEKWQGVKTFAGGGLIPGVFVFFFLLLDKENFLFGNIYYHLLNAKWRITIGSPGTWWLDKGRILFSGLFGYDVTRPILSGAVVFVFVLWVLNRFKIISHVKFISNFRPELLFTMIVLIQGVTFLFLVPFQEQYLVVLVPFFTIIAAGLWVWFIENFRYCGLIIGIIMLLYAYPASCWTTNWIRKREFSGVKRVNNLSRELARITRPGDNIFSFWPGYAVLARRKITPGMESGAFGYRITYQLSDQQAIRYHLLKRSMILKKIDNGDYPILVKGMDWGYLHRDGELSHYREVYREPLGRWAIWIRKNQTLL